MLKARHRPIQTFRLLPLFTQKYPNRVVYIPMKICKKNISKKSSPKISAQRLVGDLLQPCLLFPCLTLQDRISSVPEALPKHLLGRAREIYEIDKCTKYMYSKFTLIEHALESNRLEVGCSHTFRYML